ncbi:YidH family protein [Terriglobus sp. RCC_193]|uniref:YidH family protein n=1 Tax=Terriglobus sp. RCC_193 TaxID=3239218 RepID=UPI0035244A39
MADSPHDDPGIYLAAERTFLAWIRTGLAMMGVGFAIARFALFLRQIRGDEWTGPSVYVGDAVVVLGVMVLVVSVGQHLQLIRQLREGSWKPVVSRMAVVVAVLLALIGTIMAVYLLVSR